MSGCVCLLLSECIGVCVAEEGCDVMLASVNEWLFVCLLLCECMGVCVCWQLVCCEGCVHAFKEFSTPSSSFLQANYSLQVYFWPSLALPAETVEEEYSP